MSWKVRDMRSILWQRQGYRAGQRRGGRMVREAKALARMLRDGLRRPRADVVVSASSPPCLLMVATLVAAWHRARSVHWIMDLYPEIAVALGEVRAGFFPRMIERGRWAGAIAARRASWRSMKTWRRGFGAMAWSAAVTPSGRGFCVGAATASRADLSGCGVDVDLLRQSRTGARVGDASPGAGAFEQHGGCVRLLFQGGGPSREAAQARAAELGLRRCEWAGYVAEAELPSSLLRGQALAVTQLPAAQGLLWPSKLEPAMSLPRPILWVGPWMARSRECCARFRTRGFLRRRRERKSRSGCDCA